MRLVKDLGLGLIVAAVVGLLVGYLSHALLGLWVALGLGLVIVLFVTLIEWRRSRQRTFPAPGSADYERAKDEMAEMLSGAVDMTRHALRSLIQKEEGTRASTSGLTTSAVASASAQSAGEVQDSPALRRAGRRLGAELREVRVMIERVKATNPMVYPRDFELPDRYWQEHESFLSDYPNLYRPVEAAYAAVRRVNDTLRLREQRQLPGAPELLAVLAQDGLDRTHGLAGEALDALGELHNEPFAA